MFRPAGQVRICANRAFRYSFLRRKVARALSSPVAVEMAKLLEKIISQGK
jgi:hypothetical protein